MSKPSRSGTVPHRIADAHSELLKRRHREGGIEATMAATTALSIVPNEVAARGVVVTTDSDSSPIDLVAVIVDIACENRSMSLDSAMVHLQIMDDSISPKDAEQAVMISKTTTAFYSFFLGKNLVVSGSAVLRKEQRLNPVGENNTNVLFSVGDIVRFNRVALRKKGSNANNILGLLPGTTTPPEPAPLMEFCNSLDDPENGQNYFRLCRFDAATKSLVRTDDGSIPSMHETDSQFLEHLIVWYREKTNYFTSLLCRKILPILPHRQRSLEEMQSCVGAFGFLTQLEVTDVHILLTKESRKGSKRMRTTKSAACGMMYSMLSDGMHQMPVLDPDNRLFEVLEAAMKGKCTIELGPVQSRRAVDVPCLASGGWNDEVFLICSLQTRVKTSTAEVGAAAAAAAAATPSRGTSSQQAWGSCIADETSMQKVEPNCLVQARIIEICVNGDIVDESLSPEQTSNILFPNSDSGTITATAYPTAKVLLGLDDNDYCRDRPPRPGLGFSVSHLIVFAQTPHTIRLLCGGVEWEELQSDKTIRQHAVNFLRSLIVNRITLEWELKQTAGGDVREVVGVMLVNLFPQLSATNEEEKTS
ncbi:hypothetical protein ACA910_000197 [Epithemia clementina (nom. ined.)]